MLLGNLLTLLLLDHIDHVVALRLLSRGADLLGHGPGDGMALLNGPAAALLLGPGLGVGDGPGVADRLTDGVALLAGDSVVGGLAMGGSDGPLGNSNGSSSNTNGTGVTISSSMDSVAGLGLSHGEGGKESKENHKLLHDWLFFGLPTMADRAEVPNPSLNPSFILCSTDLCKSCVLALCPKVAPCLT